MGRDLSPSLMEVRVRPTGDKAGPVLGAHPPENPTVTRDLLIFTVEVAGASESANLTSSANFKNQDSGKVQPLPIRFHQFVAIVQTNVSHRLEVDQAGERVSVLDYACLSLAL